VSNSEKSSFILIPGKAAGAQVYPQAAGTLGRFLRSPY
jgi:hypothetical protein